MRSKIVPDVVEALEVIGDESTVLGSWFGLAGQPIALIDGLLEQGARLDHRQQQRRQRGLAAICIGGGQDLTVVLDDEVRCGEVRALCKSEHCQNRPGVDSWIG